MNSEDRALLEAAKKLMLAFHGFESAYLASLEPKPEPKRGVEAQLGAIKREVRDHNETPYDHQTILGHIDGVIALYREERERVDGVVEVLRSGRPFVRNLLANGLERRDAD